MGKTDRSPLAGKKVERDPGASRTLFTDISNRFRLPRISAKAAAVSATALTVCVAAVIAFAVGSRSTPVQAADIYIGAEESTVSISGGAGRYSDPEALVTDETVTETLSDAEASDDYSDPAVQAKESENGRYTVTFEFFGRDSISCSAENAATVGELAERMGITFTEADVLNIAEDTVISDDTVITTDKVTYGTDSVSTSIAFQTKYTEDSSMREGTSKITRYGVNGERITEYEIKYVNGVEVSRTETDSYVAKEPVDKIVAKGTAVYTPPSITITESGESGSFVGGDGKTYTYSGYIDVKATIYYTGGTTASGLPADENVIAVDPSVIPLGTKVYISGDYADIGVRIAADTGGAIKGNIIDICIDPNDPLAYGFGFRPMRVYFID